MIDSSTMSGKHRAEHPSEAKSVFVAQTRVLSGSAALRARHRKVFLAAAKAPRHATSTAADRQKRRSALHGSRFAKGLLLTLMVSGLTLGLWGCAVSARHVTRGEYIRAETQIVTLVRSNPLRLQAVVPEAAVASVDVNQTVTLSVDTYPGKTFSGVISRISPSLDEKSRTLALEATIPNTDGELKPGLFASVRLLVAKESPALMVPSGSLLAFAGLTKLYVVEGNHAIERVVKTGLRENGYVEILEGAKAGERVAVENLGKLSNGVPVKGKES